MSNVCLIIRCFCSGKSIILNSILFVRELKGGNRSLLGEKKNGTIGIFDPSNTKTFDGK